MLEFSKIMTGYMNNRFQFLKQVETDISLHLLIIAPQYPVFYKQFSPCPHLLFPLNRRLFFSLFTL